MKFKALGLAGIAIAMYTIPAFAHHSPGGLARQGWVPKTLTPGMKVTAVIHPLKDGTHGGQYMAVTLPDGTTKGNPNGAANANAGAN